MKTCKKCSAQLPDEAVYCSQCGIQLSSEAPKSRKPKRRGNGQGSVYREGSGWCAAITVEIDLSGKQKYRKKRGFKTKKEAIDYLAQLRFTPNKDSRIKSIYADIAPQLEKLSKNKQSHYRTAYSRMTVLHNQRIEALSVHDLQDVVDESCSTRYPAKDMRDLFSLIYQRAIAEQMTAVNLSKYIVLPESEEKETVPLNQTEIKSLWTDYASGNILTGCFLLMIYTGTMPGELFKITPAHIDFENNLIRGAGIKTDKRKSAPIILPDIIVPVVKKLVDGKPETERLWKSDEKSFYKYFDELKKRCSLRDDIRPYSCRHTTATALSNSDISTDTIKEIMRHAKSSTTELYIHKPDIPTKEKEAMNLAFNVDQEEL